MTLRTLALLLLLTLTACGPRLVPREDGSFLDTDLNMVCAPERVGEDVGEVRCMPVGTPGVVVYHARGDCVGPGLAFAETLRAGQGRELDGFGRWTYYSACKAPSCLTRPALFTWNKDGICDRATPTMVAALLFVEPTDLSGFAVVD